MFTSSCQFVILISSLMVMPTLGLGQTIRLDKSQSDALDNMAVACSASDRLSAGTG